MSFEEWWQQNLPDYYSPRHKRDPLMDPLIAAVRAKYESAYDAGFRAGQTCPIPKNSTQTPVT